MRPPFELLCSVVARRPDAMTMMLFAASLTASSVKPPVDMTVWEKSG